MGGPEGPTPRSSRIYNHKRKLSLYSRHPSPSRFLKGIELLPTVLFFTWSVVGFYAQRGGQAPQQCQDLQVGPRKKSLP